MSLVSNSFINSSKMHFWNVFLIYRSILDLKRIVKYWVLSKCWPVSLIILLTSEWRYVFITNILRLTILKLTMAVSEEYKKITIAKNFYSKEGTIDILVLLSTSAKLTKQHRNYLKALKCFQLYPTELDLL